MPPQNTTPAPAPVAPPPVPPAAPTPPKAPPGSWGPLLGIILIVLLLAAGGAYFFYMQEQQNAQNAQQAESAGNTPAVSPTNENAIQNDLNATATSSSAASVESLGNSL